MVAGSPNTKIKLAPTGFWFAVVFASAASLIATTGYAGIVSDVPNCGDMFAAVAIGICAGTLFLTSLAFLVHLLIKRQPGARHVAASVLAALCILLLEAATVVPAQKVFGGLTLEIWARHVLAMHGLPVSPNQDVVLWGYDPNRGIGQAPTDFPVPWYVKDQAEGIYVTERTVCGLRPVKSPCIEFLVGRGGFIGVWGMDVTLVPVSPNGMECLRRGVYAWTIAN